MLDDIRGYTYKCMNERCYGVCPEDVRDCIKSQLYLLEVEEDKEDKEDGQEEQGMQEVPSGRPRLGW